MDYYGQGGVTGYRRIVDPTTAELTLKSLWDFHLSAPSEGVENHLCDYIDVRWRPKTWQK